MTVRVDRAVEAPGVIHHSSIPHDYLELIVAARQIGSLFLDDVLVSKTLLNLRPTAHRVCPRECRIARRRRAVSNRKSPPCSCGSSSRDLTSGSPSSAN